MRRENAGRYGYSRSVIITAVCQLISMRGLERHTGKTKSTCTSRSTEHMSFVVVFLDRRRLVGRCSFSDGLPLATLLLLNVTFVKKVMNSPTDPL